MPLPHPTTFSGHIVDIPGRRIYDGTIIVSDGTIAAITPCDGLPADAPYLLPGFIDSHVHIESSMMTPAAFAAVAVRHGTVGAVADPHEIANVLGTAGIDFMTDNARQAAFHFCFGAPSCVPSCGTDIETAGACLDSKVLATLLARPDIGFLAEMMNYVGVLAGDAEVLARIEAARRAGKPIDGHAPGLVGDERRRYAAAGISTDHECATIDEGRACIAAGMKVLIREGSAAKNFTALETLIDEAPGQVMLCTDDCHPDDLVRGHINLLVRRALAGGHDLWHVLEAASAAPQRHYHLHCGLLRPGDPATFVAADTLTADMQIMQTVVRGEVVYEAGNDTTTGVASHEKEGGAWPNRMGARPLTEADIATPQVPGREVHVIVATDGSLLTGHDILTPATPFGEGSEWQGVQKMVVLNRYTAGARPMVGFVRGFGLKDGAMAATVAHDCHNIVAIGTDDARITEAINRVIAMGGGAVAMAGTEVSEMALPIAGLMSPLDGDEVARRTAALTSAARRAGCPMHAPFITMAFMCLPVIPDLKMTDRGLFDAAQWRFVEEVKE